MATVRRTTAARPKAAVTKTITELTASVAELDARLEELNEKQAVLDSLLFCIFIIHPVRAVFKMGCYIRIYAKSYEN